MRYSVGISAEWLSPFGALAISFAKPLNANDNDSSRAFQFTFRFRLLNKDSLVAPTFPL
jgi:outer membrane protein insertion porin family